MLSEKCPLVLWLWTVGAIFCNDSIAWLTSNEKWISKEPVFEFPDSIVNYMIKYKGNEPLKKMKMFKMWDVHTFSWKEAFSDWEGVSVTVNFCFISGADDFFYWNQPWRPKERLSVSYRQIKTYKQIKTHEKYNRNKLKRLNIIQ